MNKKIFTLLACAFMLLSTAFTANAKIIGGFQSTGDTVRTLPLGTSPGMYHIRIDSVYVGQGGNNAEASATGFVPAFGVNANTLSLTVADLTSATAVLNGYLRNNTSNIDGTPFNFTYNAVDYYQPGDTVVLAVNELGVVRPVSISDLRRRMNNPNEEISHLDLAATLWCTEIEKPSELGEHALYTFKNKLHNKFLNAGSSVGTTGISWMYSTAHLNGNLNYSRPLYRRTNGTSDTQYDVINYTTDGTTSITISSSLVSNFTNQNISRMLKFSIIEAAPIVLDKEAFNTVMGTQGAGEGVDLTFTPNSTSTDNPNYFDRKLFAESATITAAGNLGYLRVRAGASTGDNFIFNHLNNVGDTYTNGNGDTKYLKLRIGSNSGSGTTINNHYRFVYFPSRDSLVINAYEVRHFSNGHYGSNAYDDDGHYLDDASFNLLHPKYYGLYNEEILDALIVRYQDLHLGSATIMTIGQAPPDILISFDALCLKVKDSKTAWIDDGVYTIWDDKGRILGIRIYNGSLYPQWFYPEEGECPDRIPAYQWVVERIDEGKTSFNDKGELVNITNREFGQSSDYTWMRNVLIREGGAPIFENQTNFLSYPPFVAGNPGASLIPEFLRGIVIGQYLRVRAQDDCTLTESASGFRPVNKVYTNDQHLGYKWFPVEATEGNVNFGKSDNTPTNLGMDHNSFTFSYWNPNLMPDEDYYIDQKVSYTDPLLYVGEKNKKEGFQFMLGTHLREHSHVEEPFGWPYIGFASIVPPSTNRNPNIGLNKQYPIEDESGKIITPIGDPDRSIYNQDVKQLSRYYYELKVADFYNYRDGLAEQFVVLKGAKSDGSDLRNALKYGLADILADKEPFKFANVYLRETYFLPRERDLNEERKPQDPSRRVYYAIMDRIELEQMDRLVEQFGFEITDTLRVDPNGDESLEFSLAIWGWDENNGFIKAQGKTVSATRVSTFALRNSNYELYRRLNSTRDDNAIAGNLDAPKTLRIQRQLNKAVYLHEDALSATGYNQKNINFLGVSNSFENPESFVAPDGLKKYNYNLWIDTAYINRGTGPIKPQYLIAVAPEAVPDTTLSYSDGCCATNTQNYPPYTYGRYLINATDSARTPGSSAITNNDYVSQSNGTWDRLVFVPAIHVDDRLYILSQVDKVMQGSQYAYGFTNGVIDRTKPLYTPGGERRYDVGAITKAATGGRLQSRAWNTSNRYGDYYDFEDWDNYHNDVTFSLRFTVPEAKNAGVKNGTYYEGETNDLKRFYIESETKQRVSYGNAKIAPVQGGWIKINNDVPVISRGVYEDAINLGDVFNIDNNVTGEPTSNEGVSTSDSKVSVIAGTDEISILNAGGKTVTLTNLLGQAVLKTVLSSDRATVKAPKGVVIVTVEGEKTVKAVVK
jgi:hypothetical protein